MLPNSSKPLPCDLTTGRRFGASRAESQKTCLPRKPSDASASSIRPASSPHTGEFLSLLRAEAYSFLPAPAERTLSMFLHFRARRPSAFTLIELLVVIAIIAILIG